MTLFSFLSVSSKSVSPDDAEKRRTNYQAYRSYLNREGPKALGSKEIPKVRINTVVRFSPNLSNSGK